MINLTRSLNFYYITCFSSINPPSPLKLSPYSISNVFLFIILSKLNRDPGENRASNPILHGCPRLLLTNSLENSLKLFAKIVHSLYYSIILYFYYQTKYIILFYSIYDKQPYNYASTVIQSRVVDLLFIYIDPNPDPIFVLICP